MSSRTRILEEIKKLNLEEEQYPEIPEFEFSANLEDSFVSSIKANKGMICNAEELQEFIAQQNLKKVFSSAPEFASLSTQSISGDPHHFDTLDLAILSGQFGVAENGAIWLDDNQLGLRALPFITAHLVLVLKKENLVETMHQAYQKIGLDHSGFGLFIAGPSKTADIEQSLVIGAHGAMSHRVILI